MNGFKDQWSLVENPMMPKFTHTYLQIDDFWTSEFVNTTAVSEDLPPYHAELAVASGSQLPVCPSTGSYRGNGAPAE